MHILNATTTRTATFGRPVKTVVVVAAVLGLLSSLALAFLERRYAIIPDYTALEVVGGVILALLPVALTARHEARFGGLTWRAYERMVAAGFAGTGLPILIWQGIEVVLRHG